MVAGVNLVHRTTRLSDDTGIGLLFVGMLALGVIIISRNDTYAGDLTSFLFGDILGVDRADIVLGLVALGITIVGLLVGHRSFLALAVNHEKAAALGLRPGLAHAAMLGPAGARGRGRASGWSARCSCSACSSHRRPPPCSWCGASRRTMGVAVLFGWLSVVLGLVVSYHAETATSATIAGIGCRACSSSCSPAVEVRGALQRRAMVATA